MIGVAVNNACCGSARLASAYAAALPPGQAISIVIIAPMAGRDFASGASLAPTEVNGNLGLPRCYQFRQKDVERCDDKGPVGAGRR